MATIVFFHAHPDDECIATGGVMAQGGRRRSPGGAGRRDQGRARRGRRRLPRRGRGAVAAPRARRRWRRPRSSAWPATEFLGYVDSGMMGTPENDAPDSFWQADVDEAAERLAAILARGAGRRAHGLRRQRRLRPSRPHPGPPRRRACRRAGRTRRRVRGDHEPRRTPPHDRAAREHGADMPGDVDPSPMEFGTPEAELTTRSTCSDYLDVKREAMRRPRQPDLRDRSSWRCPRGLHRCLRPEWFILRGAAPGIREDRLL